MVRAHLYRLLARFLAAPPDGRLLQLAASLDGDASDLGLAVNGLAFAAAAASPATAADEFQDLFIGIGRGELIPYASFYIAGFLHEKPLARLRADLARLGIARAEGVKEPEDGIAALCDVMAGLVDGGFGAPADLAVQRAFFGAHLAPWAGKFFEDLESAPSARLYAPVGRLGRLFMRIEETAFALAAD